jgi:hypothetical protein
LVGAITAVLSPRRLAAFVVLLALLAAYDTVHAKLWRASDWWDVAFIAFVLIPLTFSLVWLVLPLRTLRGLLPMGLALALITYALYVADAHTAANLVKLFAVTLIGFWFLGYFETAAWVVLVALIIPWVDAYSVWKGPTKVIVTHHTRVFTALSYAFPIPGEHTAANLGVPDLLFFSLFLAAAARFALRPGRTWFALTASFGVTIALAVAFSLGGLPALPLLSVGFLAPNADLLWARLRRERQSARAVAGGGDPDGEL